MFELAIVVVVTASVIGLAGKLPDPRKVKRELAMARIVPMNSLTDGVAVAIRGVAGAVAPGDIETAPVSARPCLYWAVVFDELSTTGDFRELGRASGGTSFMLRGEGTAARIVTDNARIATPPHEIVRDVIPERLAPLVRRCKRMNYPRASLLRATEYAVLPGDVVTVKGWCTREPAPEAAAGETGYRDDGPTRPVISGTIRHRLLIG